MHKLNPTQLVEATAQLPAWTLNADGTALARQFTFVDFAQAFGFMAQVALWAEAANHHPEWHNVYNRLHITWTTHDVAGVSDNDIRMAHQCDQAFALLAPPPQEAGHG